ncbi:hypothetical protein [Desulfobotulus alkaliphilus]|uniref:hypothetical protein n=1 Tax=Desulfobotulus alkaliphilus TaxID=622671 RepID=UPI00164561A8|nr:hypothetical protein [Desulfobotulus alkaliphilus]
MEDDRLQNLLSWPGEPLRFPRNVCKAIGSVFLHASPYSSQYRRFNIFYRSLLPLEKDIPFLLPFQGFPPVPK